MNPAKFAQWQLLLLHTCARYRLFCPAFVIMPDHAHLLWYGMADQSDQGPALERLRLLTTSLLAPHQWQHQSYDHVLRTIEREKNAFAAIAHYILANPERAGLVDTWQEWPFLGCCLPGYPELSVREPDYWFRFWRLFNYVSERGM